MPGQTGLAGLARSETLRFSGLSQVALQIAQLCCAPAAPPAYRRPVLRIDNSGFTYDPAENISPSRRSVKALAIG